MRHFIQHSVSQALSWLYSLTPVARLRFISFLAGFCLVLGLSGVNSFALNNQLPGLAFAAPYNLQTMFLDENSQRSYLMAKVSHNPSHLLKVMGKDVQDLLAEPELIRQERPTIIWQYRSENCVLDVFFATMNEDPLFAPVVHFEIRDRDSKANDPRAAERCMQEMVAERGARSI